MYIQLGSFYWKELMFGYLGGYFYIYTYFVQLFIAAVLLSHVSSVFYILMLCNKQAGSTSRSTVYTVYSRGNGKQKCASWDCDKIIKSLALNGAGNDKINH